MADFAVVGGGVFGVWIARHLLLRGHRVMLIEAYGAGNSRSSSGGESRILRMGYGSDVLYTRWAVRSLAQWQEISRAQQVPLFVNCGMLWLGDAADPYTRDIETNLAGEGIPHQRLSGEEIRRRFPQFGLEGVERAIFEPGSGVLMARRAVAAVLADSVRAGLCYLPAAVISPEERGARVAELRTADGETISAQAFIFACGSWLPKVFPGLLGRRIFPSRQEVLFFGPPRGAREYQPDRMPAWLHHREEVYGLPDLEHRGIKLACDTHGEPFDPDTGCRAVSAERIQEMREHLRRRLPGLTDAPVVEARVCQYENTSNGDFLLDRHPQWENVWLAGGGSGHGFKHGPAIGQYLAGRILDGAPAEERFSLSSKQEQQQRQVY